MQLRLRTALLCAGLLLVSAMLGFVLAGILATDSNLASQNYASEKSTADMAPENGAPTASSGSPDAAETWIKRESAELEPIADPPTVANLISLREFLPHDGLYIRRNNGFGVTKQAGSQELLDQGILVDQTLITFDDFIGPQTAGIDKPPQGSAVGISVGVRPIPAKFKRDPRATHYLEISFRATDERSTPSQQVAPNFIFVIDKSGSMEGIKLDTVKQSVRFMFDQMKPDDVLGIVAFDTEVKTLLQSTRKTDIKSGDLNSLLGNLRADGGTDLNLGIGYGFEEAQRFSSIGRASQIFVFSDGEPTSGETDWLKIRQNVAQSARESRVKMTTLAYGSDANFRELDDLAGASGGKAAIVSEIADIKPVLTEELQRTEYLAAMDIEARVRLNENVGFLYFYGHDLITDEARIAEVLASREKAVIQAQSELDFSPPQNILKEQQGIKVFVPNLATGETYILMLEISLPVGWNAQKAIATLDGHYIDVHNRKVVQLGPKELTVDTGLSASIVNVHALKLATSELVYAALGALYDQNLAHAQKLLNEHADRLDVAASEFDEPDLKSDRVTLRKFIRLAANLGKNQSSGDDSLRTGTIYTLNQFGRTNNGFVRANFYLGTP